MYPFPLLSFEIRTFLGRSARQRDLFAYESSAILILSNSVIPLFRYSVIPLFRYSAIPLFRYSVFRVLVMPLSNTWFSEVYTLMHCLPNPPDVDMNKFMVCRYPVILLISYPGPTTCWLRCLHSYYYLFYYGNDVRVNTMVLCN